MKNAFPTFRRALTVSQRLGIWAWLFRVLDGWQRSPVVRFCVLVWLILFCTASLRRLATLTYLPDSAYPAWMQSDDYYDEDEGPAPPWMQTNDDGDTLAAPRNDRMALVAQAEDRPNGYDNLVRRFPDDAVIVAGYLRGRVALYGIGNRRPLYAGRRFPVDKKTLPPDWNTSISVAQHALKLEPQNAFFDMALTTLLVAVNHDQEAYRVLESGSRKPIFDDHALDAAQLQFEDKERTRTLNTEEKSYFALSAGYGNHLYRMSACLEMLSWLMWRDEQKPNAASSNAASFNAASFAIRSLRRRASIARIAAKAMVGRQSSSYISMLGNRQIFNAWRTSLQSRPRYLSRRLFSNANSTLAQAFALRARALQQPKIADETLRIMEVNENFHNSRQRSSDMDFFLGGLQALAALRWLAKAQIILCVALYLMLSLFVLKTGADTFSVPATRKIALDATIYAVVALALMLSHVYRFGEFRTGDTALWRPWFLVAPFALNLWAHWKMSRPRAQLSRNSWLQERLIEYSKLPPLRKIYSFCVAALVIQIAIFWVVIMFYMLRGRYFMVIPLPNRPTPFFWSINPSFNPLALLALVALLTLHFLVAWRWLASSEERRFTFPVLRSFRRTSGFLVASAHFLFLLSVLASLPAQTSVTNRIESYWRNGHIWLSTGFTSREWIERIDGAPSSTRFLTSATENPESRRR